MKYIPLSNSKLEAIVDDEDYKKVSSVEWSFDGHGYARSKGIHPRIRLQYFVYRGIIPNGKRLDHKNLIGLDNRKRNLRIATIGQNRANTRKYKNNTSGFKGVYWHGNYKMWGADVQKDGKKIRLGVFNTKLEAAIAYNIASKIAFGKFAKVNIIRFPR